MSRNFELLSRLGSHTDVFEPVPPIPPRSDAGTLPLEDLDRSSGTVERVRSAELERLVHRVFLIPNESPGIVAVTGIDRRSSRSSICSQIGTVLASIGGPVCIVDADPEGDPIHKQLGLKNPFGLADALR